jgi:ATP-binding cassette subfamily B protein
MLPVDETTARANKAERKPDPSTASQRIQQAVTSKSVAGKPRLMRTFWLLQPGKWWEWFVIWGLQNFRFAPIYLLPLLTGYLIDTIHLDDPHKTFAAMPWIAGATLGLCILNVLGDSGARYLLSQITRGLTAKLRMALVHRLNRLEFTFHDKEHVGDTTNKFTLDMNRLEAFQSFIAEGLLMNVTVILVMSAIVFLTNPILPAIIIVALVINVIMARLLWHHIRKAQEDYSRSEGSFLHRLNETLLGLRVARAHASEDFVEERLGDEASKVAKTGRSLDFLVNLFGSSSWAISTMLNSAVILIGVTLVVIKPQAITVLGWTFHVTPITLGQMTILLSYYGIITGAITSTINQLPTVAGASDAIRSLSTLFEDERDEVPQGGAEITSVKGDITLRDVVFSYPGKDTPSINRLSLRIPAGSSIALVGPSGGGKSTVASLVLGFYHPQDGKIEIDGQSLSAINLRSMRRYVAVVSQDVTLFNDSFLNNIAWGDRRPDYKRAMQAAELANAADFIAKYPKGMHHVLGSSGSGLSGGQRQRLAIARALYRNPRILILDEATSALDAESEHLVQVALQRAMKDRTTIIIAHRLSTIREVNNIVMVTNGQITESGTFQELIDRKGEFAQMAAGYAH